LRIIWDRNQSFRREATPRAAKATTPAKPLGADAKPWPSPKAPKTK
jgi:hypothetical protein